MKQINARKRYLIDHKLQGVLLVALIILECAMLIAGVIYLYFQFNAHIDANLYVIHRQSQQELLPLLLRELGLVIVVMATVNTLCLFIAHKLWVRHIRQVTNEFTFRLQRINAADFRAIPDKEPLCHDLLLRVDQWRKHLSEHYKGINQVLVSHNVATGTEWEQSQIQTLHEQLKAFSHSPMHK